ncbi:MAG TPA: hypothetical protein VF074_07515 [Pyrinomonadaceae bacterium]
MALNTNDETSIRPYLLGQLSVEEQNKLEERLMVEDDLFQEFEVSKVELVEDYCAGELDPTEREWLEQHFLDSPEGKHQRSLALAFLEEYFEVTRRVTIDSHNAQAYLDPVTTSHSLTSLRFSQSHLVNNRFVNLHRGSSAI